MPPLSPVGGESTIFAVVRPLSVCSSVRHSLFRVIRYRCIYWIYFNETCDKYSSCHWALQKRFSGSEVQGQDHNQTKYSVTAEAYISTMSRRCSLVWDSTAALCECPSTLRAPYVRRIFTTLHFAFLSPLLGLETT